MHATVRTMSVNNVERFLRELRRKGEERAPPLKHDNLEEQRNDTQTFSYEIKSLLTFSAALLDPVIGVARPLAAVFLD